MGTAGVPILPQYYCMYIQAYPLFFNKKEFEVFFLEKKKKHKIEVKQLAMPIGQRIIGGSSG